MKRRTGMSLIELLVVMSACAVLMTLSAAFLQRAMQAQLRSRAAVDLHRTLLRLDQMVRNDIHSASTAESDPARLMPGVILRLESPPGEVIEYRREESTLLRVQLAGGEIKSREAFSFPRKIEPEISRPQPRLVVLSISADDELDVDSPPVHVRIEAALQRDRGRAKAPGTETTNE